MACSRNLTKESLNDEEKAAMLEKKSTRSENAVDLEAKGLFEPLVSPPAHQNNNSKPYLPLTSKNLAEHHHQQTRFWNDPEEVSKLRKDQSNRLKAAAESLGIDMAIPVFGTMDQGSKGMLPEERLFAKKAQ